MDESLRLPPEQPVGELVWIAGGEVDESSVSLRFWGNDLNPDEITKILGVYPTKSHRKGEIFRGKDYERIHKIGLWLYRLKRCANVSLEDQINELFDQLPKNLEVWIELKSKFQAELFCGLWLKRWNRGVDFSPEILRRIADRCLSISLDIYFDYDEDKADNQ